MTLIRHPSTGLGPVMRSVTGVAVFLLGLAGIVTPTAAAPDPVVRIVTDEAGSKLQVDGSDFMILGMNWDYIPIGQNWSYDFWGQSDEFIEAALAREMSLLQGMGVNTVKILAGVPPRWVQYIYERYGIYTVLNHQMARYGYTLDGVWYPVADYSAPRLRNAVKAEIVAIVQEFRDTPGLLMWLLGNENNYGLSWTSFEIEALPEGEREAARARYLYSMFDEITRAIKEVDPNRPVAFSNGDLQYIDIIAEECKNLDVFGSNVYRGISVQAGRTGLDRHGPLYDVVRAKLGIPVLLTEFGADAFNAKHMREDQAAQARYLLGQWREIYELSYAKGGAGNSIGGMIFQWSDGWWKFGQSYNLEVHDTHASWPNAGYDDYVAGDNNMNEEWWGVCAKGPPDASGQSELYPRAAYFALQRAFTLDPYAAQTDLAAIRRHFALINPEMGTVEARGNRASLISETLSRGRLRGLRLEFETFNTGGNRITTPPSTAPSTGFPAFRGFDRMESFFADFEGRPAENVSATLTINMLGNVPLNPIEEIFYENRGRPLTVRSRNPNESLPDQYVTLKDRERLRVYRAGIGWDDRWFKLDGFYRTGHYHWGYEGDFFGLYHEANYGENLDIYNGEAPVGFELTGKRVFNGLKLAYGPQLWWGANPGVFLKYQRDIGSVRATSIVQSDLSNQTSVTSTVAIPVPSTDKIALSLATQRGPFGVQVGGLWSGGNKVGQQFQVARGQPGAYTVELDQVRDADAFGVKGKVTYEKERIHWYAQAAWMGPVADAGPTSMITYTGWQLKDSGLGNQRNLITGLAWDMGSFQIGPNVLWQKPQVGPMPNGIQSPGRLRNILDDPFAVRANRETFAWELLIKYDPNPETWFWEWDNDVRETAPLAASVGLVRRELKTSPDAGIGILSDGVTAFAFPASTPARNLWELHARVVSKLRHDLRIVARAYTGTGEPNGDDQRLVGGKGARRFGLDGRVVWGPMAFATYAKFNDWGNYDYHRDFNLTFPTQLMGDLSYSLGSPAWFDIPKTRLGVRGLWRSLNQYSPRFNPTGVIDVGGNPVFDETLEWPNGNEWEVRTYLHFSL